MYCPVCHCEYVARVTVCPDCQVALVPELPGASSGESPSDAPWTLIWSGGDPRRHEELCAVLEDEKIPVRSSLDSGLLGLGASLDIYVPTPVATKAIDVLREIAAAEEEWRQSAGAGELELAAEDDLEASGTSEASAAWYPEDATVEIWSGENGELASMIAASLRENMIRFRAARDGEAPDGAAPDDPPDNAMPGSRTLRLFVLPEDDARARGIVRQIVDAVAPSTGAGPA
jgi:hypothetical protein